MERMANPSSLHETQINGRLDRPVTGVGVDNLDLEALGSDSPEAPVDAAILDGRDLEALFDEGRARRLDVVVHEVEGGWGGPRHVAGPDHDVTPPTELQDRERVLHGDGSYPDRHEAAGSGGDVFGNREKEMSCGRCGPTVFLHRP